MPNGPRSIALPSPGASTSALSSPAMVAPLRVGCRPDPAIDADALPTPGRQTASTPYLVLGSQGRYANAQRPPLPGRCWARVDPSARAPGSPACLPRSPTTIRIAMRTMNPVHESTSCAVAACAEIIGAKWTALLVHDLSEGARRFSDLDHLRARLRLLSLPDCFRVLAAGCRV